MFRSASRTVLRQTHRLRLAQRQAGRRFVSTVPPSQKSRSWKSTVARWGLAAAAVYYYNTSTVFAEQPSLALKPASESEDEESSLPTIESVAAAKKRKSASRTPAPSSPPSPKSDSKPEESSEPPAPELSGAITETEESAPADVQPLQLSASELEQEADQEGAFNPETGEINWDCPCLGGMAHGPCGPEFREAFSCFVYSTEEPKGMDCIDKFKNMQDCFRLHPDVYGSELEEDEVDEQLKEHIAAEEAQKSQSLSDAPVDAAVAESQENRETELEKIQQIPVTEEKITKDKASEQ
ncbi:CHCH domain containing protein [Coccidioides posadasii C735 delta SOWgp]|uniref:Mitochondrial intermembrane space import and assembly protein 40 n=1 Tax=Coccidioides posadasii (strain C735) TaxID=222929 RepID=C5PBS5_COCP7|nr:CHCH domain containing protein [Coccidioides posadasii C735 delta SOWgp]EER25402.1 CHCH domain containing protein [Coccidioides posadasii C735 delta SOWgp]|eukprot:XP_003067547.1 CHCH domain containing protein [Coccidioides posadasii C735 delta SOWgp]